MDCGLNQAMRGYLWRMSRWAAGRCYLIFTVAFESQEVDVVPRLVPVTSTATYLPRCADVSLKVLRVAPVIFLQVDGTVLRAAVTALVHAYHW